MGKNHILNTNVSHKKICLQFLAIGPRMVQPGHAEVQGYSSNWCRRGAVQRKKIASTEKWRALRAKKISVIKHVRVAIYGSWVVELVAVIFVESSTSNLVSWDSRIVGPDIRELQMSRELQFKRVLGHNSIACTWLRIFVFGVPLHGIK